MEDRSKIIQLFDAYKDSVNDLMEAISHIEICSHSLYRVCMNDADQEQDEEGKDFVTHIPVQSIASPEQALLELRSALNPYYRKTANDSAPRLIGCISFSGTEEKLLIAQAKAYRLNQAKSAWGRELRSQMPTLWKRQNYLRNTPEFKTLMTRSVHRQIPLIDENLYASKLSWSKKGIRSVVIEHNDLHDLLAVNYRLSGEDLEIKLRKALARYSSDPKYNLVHRFSVRVHPIQTNYFFDSDGSRDRRPNKAALPLLVFGDVNVRTNPFNDYDEKTELRKVNSNRFEYHDILPEYGIYQRLKTKEELEALNERRK
jgi:hypothetical protein